MAADDQGPMTLPLDRRGRNPFSGDYLAVLARYEQTGEDDDPFAEDDDIWGDGENDPLASPKLQPQATSTSTGPGPGDSTAVATPATDTVEARRARWRLDLDDLEFLSDLYMEQHRYTDAESVILKGFMRYTDKSHVDPSDPELPDMLAIRLGICRIHQHDLPAGEAYLLRLVSLYEDYATDAITDTPDDMELKVKMALEVAEAYLSGNYHQKALGFMEMLANIADRILVNGDESTRLLASRMAECHIKLGNNATAIKLIEKILAFSDKDVGLWLQLASAYQGAGDDARAAQTMNHVSVLTAAQEQQSQATRQAQLAEEA
ncbi:hypothetical protein CAUPRSCDRAFT_12684, partial [Caulochytrium protostelioides]